MRSPASLLVGALLSSVAVTATSPKARNFIYIVPDGYGIASQTLARDFAAILEGNGTVQHPASPPLAADRLLIGTVRTQASDNLVTDSAASATAFGCGIKTYNGAIAVDDDGLPVGSVLEAAHVAGFKTGLIATSRITHATPACYASHVLHRDSENEIAGHEIGYSHPLGSVVDILMGGGRRQFIPKADGGKREDGVNLIDWAKGEGWSYAADKKELDSALSEGNTVSLPFLGLFASSHMSYELDRDPAKQPSLLDMTKISLATLEKATDGEDQGYFVMIEASRIDHAGHANDAAGHIHDTIMYNDVMAYVRQYIDSHPDTQMLSAADHECGGLTLMDGYDPLFLQKPKQTPERLLELLGDHEGDKAAYLRSELLPNYGISAPTDEEVQKIIETDNETDQLIVVGSVLAREAGLNWSTGGHTSADVALHGYATSCQLNLMRKALGGSNDNTAMPLYIAEALGLDLKATTEKLRAGGSDWIARRDELHLIKRAGNEHIHGHGH